ncbi:hypothetical protein T4D_15713 [Trichinella pseudospiralis]|uniref:Uncharacterized protein n=1 Tax=Trichinella pseudospiralis TaxID=6337 RepID=A0A0V1FWR1_TRIPS|nr:hypothetical protein T4D_15713 [Trichinella pseudospiralis]
MFKSYIPLNGTPLHAVMIELLYEKPDCLKSTKLGLLYLPVPNVKKFTQVGRLLFRCKRVFLIATAQFTMNLMELSIALVTPGNPSSLLFYIMVFEGSPSFALDNGL